VLLIEAHRPDEIAIERVFVHRNPDSALKLGQARGAAICAALGRGASAHEYAPRAIKLAVSGYGAADKAQVAQMVTALLRLECHPVADAADALAVALCHAQTRRMAALATAPAPATAPRRPTARSGARRGTRLAARSGVRP
jgi:crossover junction endodeoxyribonuclease RuvC